MATVRVENASPTYVLRMSEEEAFSLFAVIDYDGRKLSVSDLRTLNHSIHRVIEALAGALEVE